MLREEGAPFAVLRPLRPGSSDGRQRPEVAISKRRQPKSRAGCNTCKAQRRKCDESKPSCSQCIDRGLDCGGYSRELKWKLVGEQSTNRRSTTKRRSVLSDAISGDKTMSYLSSRDLAVIQPTTTVSPNADTISTMTIKESCQVPSPSSWDEDLSPSKSPGQLIDFTDIDLGVNFFLDGSNIDLYEPTTFDLATDTDIHLSNNVASHMLPQENTQPAHVQVQGLPNFSDLFLSPSSLQQNLREYSQEENRAPSTLDNESRKVRADLPEERFVLHTQPISILDSSEMVKRLFITHVCPVLPIKDDQATNSWLIYVWPLADDCPALHHALAAMTCLYLSNSQPQFYMPGIKSSQASLQALAKDEGQADISNEQCLATRLALSFSETWDCRQGSLRTQHVIIAGKYLRQMLENHQSTKFSGHELNRFSFLARTWIYKDVMRRLADSHGDEPVDWQFMESCLQLDPSVSEEQLDPLLGCAITLLPLLARLTDIIRSVRRRSAKRNSPAIISRGADLWSAIEGWSPSFDPRRSGGSSSNSADAIQTAEAYRWAALLLLRQTVPELPWAHSFWELAEKVSIYLATVPVTSPTMILHIFPFMAIGGEAFDGEDREWICQRWDAMYKRMPVTSIEQCKKVTEEVWSRRDAFEAQCGACPSCGAYWLDSATINPATHTSTATAIPLPVSNEADEGGKRCQCDPTTKANSPTSDFPDSLAFKKGVDNITRAGSLNYTVRGKLHWLGVIDDWGWKVVLG